MNKAFTKESDHEDDEELDEPSPLPVGTKNYMTPAGFLRLKTEALHLLDKERPELTKVIQWAASNGDRSENAVPVADAAGHEKTYSIVGIDEADVSRGRISWISPLARQLLKAREGDTVVVRTPGGDEPLEIVSVEYRAID